MCVFANTQIDRHKGDTHMHTHSVYLCCTREMQASVYNTERGAERKLGEGMSKKKKKRRGHRGRAP